MLLIYTSAYAFLRPIDEAEMHSSLEWEVLDLNRPDQIKHSVASGFLSLQHFLKVAMLLGCNDAVMGPANSPCTLMYYSMYNEQFDLIPFMIRFPSGKDGSTVRYVQNLRTTYLAP